MTSPNLRHIPLHALHLEYGAKITPFAGYAMPLHYGGIIGEHLHVRKAAGLFDVSHMGVIDVAGGGAARALEALMPADIVSLPRGRQRYALLTNARGGIIDDLMVQNLGEHFRLVVNAACKTRDAEHLRAHLNGCTVDAPDDGALLALQGPAAAAALSETLGGGDLSDMKFMDARALRLDGIDCMVARSGYTGEDGFEVSLPAARAEQLARRLLANPQVRLAGLGARDSLRMEAGLRLHGSDIGEATTPVEAGLGWAVAKSRRNGGARAGGFPGADVILQQLSGGAARRLIGLIPRGRAPVRAGAELLGANGAAVGEVTSGGFGPSVSHPISLGYAQSEHAAPGAELRAPVRGRELPLTVAALPFVRHNFHR